MPDPACRACRQLSGKLCAHHLVEHLEIFRPQLERAFERARQRHVFKRIEDHERDVTEGEGWFIDSCIRRLNATQLLTDRDMQTAHEILDRLEAAGA